MTAVVRAQTARRTETPNGVMTTLASPTQGPADQLSIWKIAMQSGRKGPHHIIDREQVWHVLSGEAEFAVGGETHRLGAGDTVILPAGAERQVTALTGTEIIACGPPSAIAWVVGEDAPRGTPPWIS